MSHYHTSEEKPRLQIEEDRVLCLFFIGGREGSKEVQVLCAAFGEVQWPCVANTDYCLCFWPFKCIYGLNKTQSNIATCCICITISSYPFYFLFFLHFFLQGRFFLFRIITL